MSTFHIRQGRIDDLQAAYYICLKTGDHGADGEPLYQDDPGALGRIFVGPYLAFEPEFSLMLEDSEGVCGYAFASFDSRTFYDRYEREWRPKLCEEFSKPTGDRDHWTPAQEAHSWYHEPDYYCPEPYDEYPSHLHIDFLGRARGHGFGRQMMETLMDALKEKGSPGAHLGVSIRNTPAFGFYEKLGFKELARVGGSSDGCVYFGKKL
ncbi:MAG: GNAT family N-acetyltransferase [Verrucomicrobia bacterium]|jgi:GNAT superfamily N-acetyltransferase|nr:GNAT family N-acetyltransferase [Verrucomicrobiota bacterium]